MALPDTDFIQQFEDCTLPPAYFDHAGHLRLAWLYLRDYPLEQAVARVTGGIAAYANSQGAADKFRHTLTEAIVRIMAHRQHLQPARSLEDFLAANPDLVEDILGVVGQHYSPQRLASQAARTGFVSPDLAPLPGLAAA